MEDQDQKFNVLKTRLDAMNYKHPFSTTSINLIEALLNDISRLSISLEKSRKSQGNQEAINSLSRTSKTMNRASLKTPDLRRTHYPEPIEESEKLQRSTTEVQKENKMLVQKSPAMNNPHTLPYDAKNAEYIEKLFTDCNSLKKTLEESEENSQRLAYENKNLSDRLRSSENQIVNLKSELDITLKTIKSITGENKSTTEELYSQKQIISSYESRQSLLKNESNRLRMEMQKLEQTNRSLEQQVLSMNKENMQTREELEGNTSAKIRVNSQLENLQRQFQILQGENNKLNRVLQEDKESISKLEERYKDLEDDYQGLQDKLRSVHKDNQNFGEKLREKEETVRSCECMNRNLEKDIKELKVFVTKFEDSQNENRKLKESSEDATFEIKKLRQNLDDVRATLKYKEEEIRQFKSYLDQSHKDLEKVKNRLEEETVKMEGYNICQRNNNFLEEQLRLCKGQLEESIAKERQVLAQSEHLNILIRKNEEKLQFSSKMCEKSQTQKVLVEEDNTKLQKNLKECMARDSSKTLEITRLEGKLQQSHCEIDELKRQINKATDELFSLQEEQRNAKVALDSEREYISRQNEQILQLKEYVNNLEVSRIDTLKTIEILKISEADQINAVKRIREEATQLKKQVNLNEKICVERNSEVDSLKHQIDSIKSEGSRKCDEISNLKSSLRNYMNEIEELKLRNKVLQESEENFKRNWRESEIENSRLSEINKAMLLQSEDNQKLSYRLQIQVQGLNKNLLSLEDELAVYTDKLKVANYEKDVILNQLEEANKDIRSREEKISMFAREKDDLCVKYQLLSEDFNKLSHAYDQMNEDFSKLSVQYLSLEKINESLRKQEEMYMRNTENLEKEIRNAVRMAELADYKREEAEKTSEALMQDMHSVKSLTKDLDYNCDDLQRKLYTVENEKSYFETRFRSAENELSQVKSELEYEKQRASEFESRSMREGGMRRHEIDEERIKSFQQPNPDLVSELYKQIEAYKSDSLKLEMDYMKIMDDLTRTKHQLHQTEAKLTDFEISRR